MLARPLDTDSFSVAGSHKSHKSSASKGSKASRATSRSSKASKRGHKKDVANEEPVIVEEPKQPFDLDLVADGLSQLGKTADGLKPAYLTVTITGTDLANTDPLITYPHLQTVVLNDNRLTDIQSLGSLRSLTYVDVSKNKLTQVLDIKLASADVNVRYADFSHNAIQMLRDLSPFSRLADLKLDGNKLDRIAGLATLTLLKSLSIADNRLGSAAGLATLSNLRELNLDGNAIDTLAPLEPLRALQVLSVARNRLSHLRGLGSLAALRRLDVSGNSIQLLEEVSRARDSAFLDTLSIAGNPVTRIMAVRLHVVYLLPQVTMLDGEPVAAKEKVLAANMHGADAEDLRRIRRRFFPNGELDDGGGAIPPMAAGLIASRAEEEAAENVEKEYVRLDAWAASLKAEAYAPKAVPASPLPPGTPLRPATGGHSDQATAGAAGAAAAGGDSGGADGSGSGASPSALLALADQLRRTCTSQLQQLRVCHEWLVRHTAPPPLADTCLVDVPLFGGPKGPAIEAALLGGVQGMWSERCVWLFMQLCRACGLEAVSISGYWRNGLLAPGQTIYAHNHCWAAAKVNGKWRLMDPTRAALMGGQCPFYVPPDAFIYSYWPLEAAWQLLPEPLNLETWWALPNATVDFFALGGQIMDPRLAAVNELPAPKQGALVPSIMVPIALPKLTGSVLSHRVVDAASGKLLAAWPPLPKIEVKPTLEQSPWPDPPEDDGSGTTWQPKRYDPPPPPPPLAPGLEAQCFHQVVAGPRGTLDVRFGASSFGSRVQQLWAVLPGPGAYYVEAVQVKEVRAFRPMRLEGLPMPLKLRVVEEVPLLSVKMVVPPLAPHDPEEDGILHAPELQPRPLPRAHALFGQLGAQLVTPPPNVPLEADRLEPFNVVVPEATRVALVIQDPLTKKRHFQELPAVDGSGVTVALGNARCTEDGREEASASASASASAAADAEVARAQSRGPAAEDEGLDGELSVSHGPGPAPTSSGSRPGSGLAAAASANGSRRPSSAAAAHHVQPQRPTSGGASAASSSAQANTFAASLQVPRAGEAQIMAYIHEPACSWVPLLSLTVLPQGQHIVYCPETAEEPEYDIGSMEVKSALDMFRAMDANADGSVTRKEMLMAFKRNRQTADILKFPHAVRQWDGTWERFLDAYLQVDSARLGGFKFADLAAYMGIRPANEYSDSEDEDDDSGSGDGSESEEEEDEEAGEEGAEQ